MQWVAYYDDGTHLRQYDDAGTESEYADIDRARLVSFALYDGGLPRDGCTEGLAETKYATATRKLLHLHLDPNQRLIYRRRVPITQGGGEGHPCYMIGWQQTIYGQNVQSICYVFEEDGTVEVAGRYNESHPWFYSPQSVPGE